MLDLQVNGFAGVDFNDADVTVAGMEHALSAMAATGVTHCLPTIITAEAARLEVLLRAVDRAVAGGRFADMVVGYHLEGPFLDPRDGYAGCHPAVAMIRPDVGLLARWCAGLSRPVRLVTLAPDLAGAEAAIAWLAARGVAVALGHHGAGAVSVARAAELGARLSTHLGNAMPRMLDKFDNPLMAQLAEDRLSASFIADGIHVPPAALRVMMRAKGFSRCVLVTDGTAASGAAPGDYAFAGMTIRREADGAVRVPGSTRLAGSSLTLDRAVANVVAWGIASEAEARAMAGANAWAVLGGC